jgi:putative NADH-flavin reductase
MILGATGKTGQALVAQALARGWRVTALVRDPSRLGITHERLATVQGDMANSESLTIALKGPVDAVVSALGVYSKVPTTALTDATRIIVNAMRAAGCARIVIVSSLGAGDSLGQGTLFVRAIQRWILKYVLLDKTSQEEVLRGSGLQWTSLRPPQLTDDPKVRDDLITWSGTSVPARRMRWKVSRATVARYALDAVEHRRWVNEAVMMVEPA